MQYLRGAGKAPDAATCNTEWLFLTLILLLTLLQMSPFSPHLPTSIQSVPIPHFPLPIATPLSVSMRPAQIFFG